MGSYCDLRFGRVEVDGSKNHLNPLFMSMFSERDKDYRIIARKDSPDFDGAIDSAEADDEYQLCTYRTTVGVAKRRLEILGINMQAVESEYLKGVQREIDELEQAVGWERDEDMKRRYDSPLAILKSLKFSECMEVYKLLFGRLNALWELEVVDQAPLCSSDLEEYLAKSMNGTYEEFLTDTRFWFRLLLECFEDHEEVVLDVSGLIGGGYIDEDDPLVAHASMELTQHFPYAAKIIVLTEGSSDIHILRRALKMLYPEFYELYSFMDFGSYKSPGGAPALVTQVKAFLGAGINNRIVAVFDNDTVAHDAIRAFDKMQLPSNTKVLVYPDMERLNSYPTVGPGGEQFLNVNGLAGSIELYLCEEALMVDGQLSRVQWTGYNSGMARYQGEVMAKSKIQERFFEIADTVQSDPSKADEYNWDGLRKIWQHIFLAFDVPL
jgi:hypothetical protein